MGRKRGYAFIYLLCISILISALLMGVLTLSLSAKRSTKSLEDTYRLSSMSESGIEKGMSCLKQKISNNTNVFSDTTTKLACDKFSFEDSGITCTVKVSDDTIDKTIAIIDSTAVTSKGRKKEDTVYLKKSSISNTYYSMLFNNVITVLGKKNETDPKYTTAFDMADGKYDISLDGNMYLQGNKVNFTPSANPASNPNDSVSTYDYSDATGNIITNQPYPKPDTIAPTYHSGKVYINSSDLTIPVASTDALKEIFNPNTTYVSNTTPITSDDIKSEVKSYQASEYPMLDVTNSAADINLYDELYPGDTSFFKINTFLYGICDLIYNANYHEYLVLPSNTNGNTVTLLVTKIDKTADTEFDISGFIHSAKPFIMDNFPTIKAATSNAQKEALYKGLYQLYVIEGNAKFPLRSNFLAPPELGARTDYDNIMIYCSGRIRIFENLNLLDILRDHQNLSFQNSSMMARSIIIQTKNSLDNEDPIPNMNIKYQQKSVIIGYIFGIPIYGSVDDTTYMKSPFERAITLHGIDPLGAGIGVDGLASFNQDSRNFINNFLNEHLTGYSKYYTFTIDKWVEK